MGGSYLDDRVTGTVAITDASGRSYSASSRNSCTSLPSRFTSSAFAIVMFFTNGDASSSFMKRVSAWISTVWPAIWNLSTGGGGGGGGGAGLPLSPLPALGGGAGATGTGGAITAVCTMLLSQVYGGSARLTSSMMCDQVKRSLSMLLMMSSWRLTESR